MLLNPHSNFLEWVSLSTFFIYSFNKYLLSTYSVPDTVLDPWDTSVNRFLFGDSLYPRGEGDTAAATAARSLQSCPTLCGPIDGSPPGFPVPGTLQARTLEWVAISFSNAWKWKVKVKSRPTLATPWTAAYQAPPSMGFSRQEYWSGVPLPSPFQSLPFLKVSEILGPSFNHSSSSGYPKFFPISRKLCQKRISRNGSALK